MGRPPISFVAGTALELAGAGPIGIVVIGRHVRPEFNDNENERRPEGDPSPLRLRSLRPPLTHKAGAQHDWRETFVLFWLDEPMDRGGAGYQRFLDDAFDALFDSCPRARNALVSTGTAALTHRRGSDDAADTVLTRSELCDRLMRIRDRLTA